MCTRLGFKDFIIQTDSLFDSAQVYTSSIDHVLISKCGKIIVLYQLYFYGNKLNE